MKTNCHSSAVRLFVVSVASRLASHNKPISQEGSNQTPSGERPQAAVIDRRHMVTATRGSSYTVTPTGMGSPSSSISSITIWATSWMF